MTDDKKLQLYYCNGESYWAPADREYKINRIRKWKQAFRVYAAIYCEANPGRSAEIWQYVYIINKAAMSWVWENVYFYDVTFRQLMAENPSRRWAKTYNQMWNIAMCEPLRRNNFSGNGGGSSYHTNGYRRSSHSPGNNQSSAGANRSSRPKYCWKFNKNKDHGSDCDFVHRCSVCDSPITPELTAISVKLETDNK